MAGVQIEQYIQNERLRILVKPNAQKTRILEWDANKEALRIAVAAVPEKGKANAEVIKFFSELLGK